MTFFECNLQLPDFCLTPCIRKQKKSKFWYFGQNLSSAAIFSDGPSANLRKFWTYRKYIESYTNRRRILRWFQKCITLYGYFEYFLTYGDFKAKKGPFFEIFCKRGPFETSRAPKSGNTQNNPLTLYISEISVKFCVDWYTNLCLTFAQNLRIYTKIMVG